MAYDVEDLTTFYANLPSIFENNSSSPIEPSYNTIITDSNINKSYQPMFSSFLFADSDPLSRAAFIASSSPSIQVVTTQERQIDDNENNISSSMQTLPSSHPPLAPTEDIDDDEDDFDGIPLRHASIMVNKKLNGDSDLIINHSKQDHLFDEFARHIENSHEENDLEDDSFLNGFTDEQHDTTAIVPSLFKDIPDIDDLNEHEEDNDRIPFDHMDMFDQSDSIRSSSPDSLLSSSHQEDDDADIDEEVEQWNDDLILNTTSNKNPSLVLHINPTDQVDFIDLSRSNSRCSDVSSHLSIGYADQARQFMSDDGLMTSSESDDDDEMNLDGEPSDHEELCLQVNLDDHQSVSSFSTRSSSPIPDETPIVDIDELKTLQIAPIAALEDENDNDMPMISSDIKNLYELQTQKRQNEIVHDIINIRNLFNDNDHDDEFLAVIHNPKIFEQVLHDQKKSDLVKQTNPVTSTFRLSSQLSIDNEIKKESFEHHQNTQQTSSLLVPDNQKTSNASSSYPVDIRKTTNNSSLSTVNHLTSDDEEEKENDVSQNVVNTTDTHNIKQKDESLPQHQTNTNIKQFPTGKISSRNMSTDNESDDDSELLKILSQLHGTINPPRSSNQLKSPLSSYSPNTNQKINFPDFASKDIITNGNETELLKKKNQQTSHIISSSPYVINTIKKTDEEKKEKSEEKNVIFSKNHNNDDGDDKQKKKYERKKEEKKKLPTFFSLTSTTSPILFNDDSQSPVVILDPDTSSSLPNFLLSSNQLNKSTLFTNQLITDDLQISKTKSNMNNLSNDDLTQQTTTDLFDPFAPTTTTTMFDDVFVDKKDADVKEFGMRPNFLPSNSTPPQPLSNYNFDDLWNQSMSHIDSSNNDIDPNTFAWDAFLNTNENTNPFNDISTIPTWDNLFDEKQPDEDENDLNNFLHWIISKLDHPEHVDSQPTITFTSTQNLESIIKDMVMCAMPFDPIPSPPLHVDHTVTNAMINAIHHELFPIDELEQPNISQGQPSMILYEEDEEEEDNELLSFDDKVQPVVEKLVSDVLQLALTQIDQSYDQVEHFVDQILAQAIFEVNNEDEDIPELETNDIISTENLSSIITWHDQTNKQLLDPFDKKFDSVWSSHFQAPDNTLNENKNDIDPWLTTTTATTAAKVNNDGDTMLFFSQTLDDSDLFSSTSNPTANIQETEDDEAGTLSEYVQPALLTSPANSTAVANNMMKYTLTAPVMDDSGDDSSTIDDYFAPRKNESSTDPNVKIEAEPTKSEDFTSTQENIFSSKARLSQFEAFASDQPLNSPEIESKFADITDDNTAWTSVENPSNEIGDNEPWELEDSSDEKLTPIPTTTRLTEAFDSHQNFFSDSFKPSTDDYLPKHQLHDETEQTLTKTVRFDDNVQNILVPTISKDDPEDVESSSTSGSDEVKVYDITPSFDTITNRMETSYVSVDEIEVEAEHSYESVKLNDIRSENADLPSTPLNDRTNISNDNIPLKSSHIDSQYKTNLPSEIEITTTTTTDTRLPSDTQLVRPFESGACKLTVFDWSSAVG